MFKCLLLFLFADSGENPHKSSKVNGVCLLALCFCSFCSGTHSPSQSYRTSWWYWTKKKRTKSSKCKGSTRSLNRDCNRPWKKPEASLDNPSGGTGHQTKLDIIFKMKRHFSGHLIVVTLPLHPSIKDWLTAPIKWAYCIFFFWNLLSQDQSQSKNRKPVLKLCPSTNQTQLLVCFSAVPSDGEASWKMLGVKPNRNIYWLMFWAG